MRTALALATLLLPVLAGCLAAPAALTPTADAGALDLRRFDLGQVLEATIPLPDGVALHGTVYLPDVPEGEKVPVVMDLGPYYGNLNPETGVYSEKHPPNLLYEDLLRHGYAIALVSVRGTGQSGGCFMVGGPQERQDAAAAVEWLAAQAWSDGSVAMSGVSYDGTTPWEALVEAPPALKAIVPVAGITDFYRYSFFEGVPVGGGAAFNTYYKALVDVAYLDAANVPAWLAVQPSALCPEQAEVYLEPYRTYQDGVHGPYWDERDMSAMLDGATAAVLVVHGLKDFNVRMDNVQTVWDKLPGPKRMLLGQWAHNIPWRNTYDREMSWHEYNATVRSFLDAHVRGDARALAEQAAAPPVLVQDTANVTWRLSEWPPAESTLAPFHLAPDGALSPEPAPEGEARFRASPDAGLVPLAEKSLLLGPREIVFETEPFAEETRFFGNPELLLRVQVDRPEGHLLVKLHDVAPDGERTLVSLGWQNLATRTTRDQAEDVPTGEWLDVRVLMEAIAERVEPGHRLALAVTADNDQTLTPRPHATTFTLALGGEEGARLLLPRFEPPADGA